jgi:hypothetical protein
LLPHFHEYLRAETGDKYHLYIEKKFEGMARRCNAVCCKPVVLPTVSPAQAIEMLKRKKEVLRELQKAVSMNEKRDKLRRIIHEREEYPSPSDLAGPGEVREDEEGPQR